MEFFDAGDLEASGKESEVRLSEQVRMHSLVVFERLVGCLIRLEDALSFNRISNSNLRVQDTFKLPGHIASILHIDADFRKFTHVAINLAIEIMLLCNLSHSELEHEFAVICE